MGSSRAETTTYLRFSALSEFERSAIILRSAGKTWSEVAFSVNDQSRRKKPYAEATIRMWFGPGGKLEAAYDEYNDELANQAIKNARQAAKKLQTAAIATMGELLKSQYDGPVRLGAARALANKYLPDRQILTTEPGGSDLPPDLLARGDEIAEQSDDAPQSAEADSGAGRDAGEGLPAPVLQQPDEPDRPSDPPA